MSEQADTREALLDAGLALIAHQGWHRTTIIQIAMELGAPVLEAVKLMPGKVGLLIALLDRIDASVASQTGNWSSAEPAQDRLFDAIMARFEAMQANREGVVAILKGLRLDPVAVAAITPRYDASLNATLDGAGLSADLVAGLGRRAALSALMLDLMRVWVADNSEDMGATMAALGKRLEQANGLQAQLENVTAGLGSVLGDAGDG
ncbi:MAG: TetR/AcrR family transcriptional regulator [Alphaproteobacteria bacterium]